MDLKITRQRDEFEGQGYAYCNNSLEAGEIADVARGSLEYIGPGPRAIVDTLKLSEVFYKEDEYDFYTEVWGTDPKPDNKDKFYLFWSAEKGGWKHGS